MPQATIAAGQIWRQDATGSHFLVTRVYAELFDRFAILRRVEGEETVRLKLRPGSAPLPGYTQESAEFNESSPAATES
jgi:hypothetical protein